MKTKPRLSRNDWIKAAFRALTKGGPQAIKAERLARALAVSKGSFYWHFKDVADLKAAMILHWQQIATQTVIDALEQGDLPAHDRLRALIEITASARNAAYGGALAEAAIRDWARYERAVKDAVRSVEGRRLDYVHSLFMQTGLTDDQARTFANVLYGALIGIEQLGDQEHVSVRHDMLALLDRLLSSGAAQR